MYVENSHNVFSSACWLFAFGFSLCNPISRSIDSQQGDVYLINNKKCLKIKLFLDIFLFPPQVGDPLPAAVVLHTGCGKRKTKVGTGFASILPPLQIKFCKSPQPLNLTLNDPETMQLNISSQGIFAPRALPIQRHK